MKFLSIIQARLGSTRFPNKVMQTVGGVPMVKRVWHAARAANLGPVVVAWPERYPDLDENDVLERFRRIAREYRADTIIRLTSDCPLLNCEDILKAAGEYIAIAMKQGRYTSLYYSNHLDGHDVQIFSSDILFGSANTHREHVIADFSTEPTGLSVNTKLDLRRVRAICNLH